MVNSINIKPGDYVLFDACHKCEHTNTNSETRRLWRVIYISYKDDSKTELNFIEIEHRCNAVYHIGINVITCNEMFPGRVIEYEL